MGTTTRPSLTQIERKSTWSAADEQELFDALPRARTDYRRAQILAQRSDAIANRHPAAAAMLLETLIDRYEQVSFVRNGSYLRLANLYERMGRADAARVLLRANIEANSREGRPDPEVLLLYVTLLLRHHQDDLAFLAASTDEIDPAAEAFRTGLEPCFQLLSGVAYAAHLGGDGAAEERYLARSQALLAEKGTFAWAVPEPWCRWYYDRTGRGGKHYRRILVRPGFSLAEMRDWAEESRLWKRPEESVSYRWADDHEHLALLGQGLCIDLRVTTDRFTVGHFLSDFRKKNLGTFDVTGVAALVWTHVGDFHAAENVNDTIEVLNYLMERPDVAVDVG